MKSSCFNNRYKSTAVSTWVVREGCKLLNAAPQGQLSNIGHSGTLTGCLFRKRVSIVTSRSFYAISDYFVQLVR